MTHPLFSLAGRPRAHHRIVPGDRPRPLRPGWREAGATRSFSRAWIRNGLARSGWRSCATGGNAAMEMMALFDRHGQRRRRPTAVDRIEARGRPPSTFSSTTRGLPVPRAAWRTSPKSLSKPAESPSTLKASLHRVEGRGPRNMLPGARGPDRPPSPSVHKRPRRPGDRALHRRQGRVGEPHGRAWPPTGARAGLQLHMRWRPAYFRHAASTPPSSPDPDFSPWIARRTPRGPLGPGLLEEFALGPLHPFSPPDCPPSLCQRPDALCGWRG